MDCSSAGAFGESTECVVEVGCLKAVPPAVFGSSFPARVGSRVGIGVSGTMIGRRSLRSVEIVRVGASRRDWARASGVNVRVQIEQARNNVDKYLHRRCIRTCRRAVQSMSRRDSEADLTFRFADRSAHSTRVSSVGAPMVLTPGEAYRNCIRFLACAN